MADISKIILNGVEYDLKDSTARNDLATALARMSTLLAELQANPDYAPTAEVVDIRTGYDGTVYELAGDAVRALGQQISELQEKFGDNLYFGWNYENSILQLTLNGKVCSDPVTIVSGSGGTGSTSSVKLINLNEDTIFTLAYGDPLTLKFSFSSMEDDVPTGNGTCQITVNGVVKATFGITQGEHEIDVGDYLTSGENTVKVTCTDVYGSYRILTYTATTIDLRLESSFDDTVTYSGDVIFRYTPYGLVSKVVHILLDGEEVETVTISASGRQSTKTFGTMSHGMHSIEAYITATLDELSLESPHLLYEFLCIEEDQIAPMLASAFVVKSCIQGEQLSIPHMLYDPSSLNCEIIRSIYTIVDGERVDYSVQPITVDRSKYNWNTRRYPVGTVYFEISYPDGGISRTHTVTVEEANIPVEAVTNELELYLTSAGRSNSEVDPSVWGYGEVYTTFENVNWHSTGWIEDENSDVVLRLNGDARATIHFKPFEKDLSAYGKTIEVEFAVRDLNNRNAVLLQCVDENGVGITITPDTATLSSMLTSIDCRYRDEDKLRVSFVIESTGEDRLMKIYLNGVLSATKQYPTTDTFLQSQGMEITMGSNLCGIDIYTIRSYTTALLSTDIVNNAIADETDIGAKMKMYQANKVYDEYGRISFDLMKDKIPVITVIGAMPQSKGDKKTVYFKFQDPENSVLNFEAQCTIDVQGTSSQYYVIKNWKVSKFDQAYQHAMNQLPTTVFCLKADYAEATGTHNTQNANLIHTLYDEPTPAQEDEPLCRTTIFGFPCVLFHQEDESSEIEFVGKYNFNYDKGSENVFGFTEAYDVESWEFCNNTSDACLFKGNIPDVWGDDFEARYPEDSTDLTRFRRMHAWVVSTRQENATGEALEETVTYDDVTYDIDTAEYRLAKFRAEFEDYFDMHYALIYYVYTFVMLMVDQRAKNMFLTYWGETGKWQPWLYDNDTCLGINNEGQMVFDYYHEDTDQVNNANVYNGQESTLWVNFRQAFPEKIQETYQSLRGDKKITYDKLVEYFITGGSDKWSASVYNEDSEYKYISMLRSDGDSTNLYQVRGTGEEHFKYFIENRLNYCDGKWYATDYADDYVYLRIYTPTEYAGVEPCADITVTPFSAMYAGVRYKANGTLYQERVKQNEEVKFEAPDETFNDTETAVYGASNLSSLGDLAPLYCGTIDVSSACKLVELKIGDATDGYSNEKLEHLSVGTNKLLKKIDIQNCPNLTDPLGLTGCPNIEEIYANGSGITGVDLAESGCVKIMQLPASIIDLTIKNQYFIEELTLEGTENVKTLRLENCPTIDAIALLDTMPNVERVRFAGVNWAFETPAELKALVAKGLKGINENGEYIDYMWVDGKCHITTATGAQMVDIVAAFPYLELTFDNITADIIYMSWDGTTELYREAIANGGNATDPTSNGTISKPSRASTAQYNYTFSGWSTTIGGTADANALKTVTADRYVYAAYTSTIRTYTVYFYNGSTLLQTVTDVPYGGSATYTGDTPVHTSDPENYEFTGWSPSPQNITGTTSCYAAYKYTALEETITDSWEEIFAAVDDGTYSTKYAVGDTKILELGSEGAVCMQITAFDADDKADGSGKAPISWISQQLLLTSKRFNPSLVTNYDYPEIPSWTASGNTWTSKNRYNISNAKATWTITATEAGTLTISYKTSNGTAGRCALSLTVNGEAVATDYCSTTAATHTVEVAAGDVVVVSATYKQLQENRDYYGTVTFSSTGTFTTDAAVENAPNRVLVDYSDATGAIGGWEKSELRGYYQNTLKSLIPEDVRNRIISVTKTQPAYDTAGKSFTQTTQDEVWMPSYNEMFGASSLYYPLFQNTNANRVKKKSGATSASHWWLRSASSTSGFNLVYASGSYGSYYASNSYALALGFCT